MAHWSRSLLITLQLLWALLFACSVFYTLRLERQRASSLSCRQCPCDCSGDIAPAIMPSSGFTNTTLSDCGEDVPGMKEELGKDLAALTLEVLHLHSTVANETLEKTESLILHANKKSLHYRREAAKCWDGVKCCEAGRERAQAALAEERRLSDLWQRRARELGWQ